VLNRWDLASRSSTLAPKKLGGVTLSPRNKTSSGSPERAPSKARGFEALGYKQPRNQGWAGWDEYKGIATFKTADPESGLPIEIQAPIWKANNLAPWGYYTCDKQGNAVEIHNTLSPAAASSVKGQAVIDKLLSSGRLPSNAAVGRSATKSNQESANVPKGKLAFEYSPGHEVLPAGHKQLSQGEIGRYLTQRGIPTQTTNEGKLRVLLPNDALGGAALAAVAFDLDKRLPAMPEGASAKFKAGYERAAVRLTRAKRGESVATGMATVGDILNVLVATQKPVRPPSASAPPTTTNPRTERLIKPAKPAPPGKSRGGKKEPSTNGTSAQTGATESTRTTQGKTVSVSEKLRAELKAFGIDCKAPVEKTIAGKTYVMGIDSRGKSFQIQRSSTGKLSYRDTASAGSRTVSEEPPKQPDETAAVAQGGVENLDKTRTTKTRLQKMADRTVAQWYGAGNSTTQVIGPQANPNAPSDLLLFANSNGQPNVSVGQVRTLMGGLNANLIIAAIGETIIVTVTCKALQRAHSPNEPGMTFQIKRSKAGKLNVLIDSVHAEGSAPLIGRIAVLKMVASAKTLGFDTIELTAGGLGTRLAGGRYRDLQGYRTWPTLGFDGSLGPSHETVRSFLQANPAVAKRVGLSPNDVKRDTRVLSFLFDRNGHRVEEAWTHWRQHGRAYEGTIELKNPNSKSNQILNRALSEFGL
jgi:hypothetical protein